MCVGEDREREVFRRYPDHPRKSGNNAGVFSVTFSVAFAKICGGSFAGAIETLERDPCAEAPPLSILWTVPVIGAVEVEVGLVLERRQRRQNRGLAAGKRNRTGFNTRRIRRRVGDVKKKPLLALTVTLAITPSESEAEIVEMAVMVSSGAVTDAGTLLTGGFFAIEYRNGHRRRIGFRPGHP
ncbi:MAG: hypothetical protein U5O39_11810 [Gammaproteobacteria bacterium]|nr:hypothetical protein [Gammaproteobacteria bacterium]